LAAIAVVVPAFRAHQHIQQVLEGIPQFVTSVIVVDDCSPDHTSEIVRDLQAKDPRITLIQHSENQGVGGAMITGYKAALDAGAIIVVKIDADGQMDPLYIPDLIAPIVEGKADYAKGNRFLHPHSLIAMPWIRQIGNIGLSFLTKLASGYWNIFDPTNGYTAIHATAIKFLDLTKLDRRYFFESSMLIELGIIQAVVKDVYIPAVYKGENSSLSEAHSFLSFPWKLLGGLLHRIMAEYFIRDFNVVSLLIVAGIPFILFGTFGIASWSRSAYLGVAATTGTVMIAILPLILGAQFLLQALTLDVQDLPTSPLQEETHHLDNLTQPY
jgi:dolichol-phosphate mannosyltransferase